MIKLDVSIPPSSDHIIGFTIPKAGTFYICDHDAVWHVVIGPTPRVEQVTHSPYEFDEGRTDFLGLVFEGNRANDGLLRVGQNRISYDFRPKQDRVTVSYDVDSRRGQIEFPISSGDWFRRIFLE